MTFLGPSLLSTLEERGGRLESTRTVHVSSVGAGKLLRAGDVPERGDINRLWLPAAYVDADRSWGGQRQP